MKWLNLDRVIQYRLRGRLITLSLFQLLIGLAALLLSLAAAWLPLPIALLLLLAPLAIVLVFSDPAISLFFAILSVPVQEWVLLPGRVSLTQAAMLLALFHAILSWSVYDRRNIRLGRVFPFWAVFLWVLVLSTSLTVYSPLEGVKETLRWAEAFVVWLIAVNLVRGERQAIGLLACLLLAPAAEALLGLAQFATGFGPPSFRITPSLPFVRAYGTIGQPNSFAGYLNMAWPLALAVAIGLAWERVRARRLWFRALPGFARMARAGSPLRLVPALQSPSLPGRAAGLTWVATLLLLAALAASLSRGAWVGAAIGLLGMALALGGRARLWALAALGLAALALALGGGGLLPAFLAERLISITRYIRIFDAGAAAVTPANFAVVERMSQMQAGWRMFLAHALVGVGPGNYSTAYPSYAVGTWYVSRGHAHNYYIQTLAETGLLGLIAYLALLAGLIRQAAITLRSAKRLLWRSAAIGCCGIIAAVVGHDLFENLHVLSLGIQLAAVWALLTIIEDVEKRPQNQNPSDNVKSIGV